MIIKELDSLGKTVQAQAALAIEGLNLEKHKADCVATVISKLNLVKDLIIIVLPLVPLHGVAVEAYNA